MAKETSPAFQFYVKEWRSSRAVQRMTYDQRGRYFEMLLEQWESMYLPDDPRAVAYLIGGDVEGWIAAWPVIRRKFCDRRGRPRKGDDLITNYADESRWDAIRQIHNLKLEVIRQQSKRYKKAAKIGGQSRAKRAKRGSDGTYEHVSQPAVTPAVLRASASGIAPAISSTASATASATASPTAGAPTPPLTARSNRIVFSGAKLTVFEWQLDECQKTLGQCEDQFGALGDWFADVDERAVRDNLVIPRRDGAQWLLAELLTEARRRGLPLRVATTAQFGKQTSRLASALANIRAEGA